MKGYDSKSKPDKPDHQRSPNWPSQGWRLPIGFTTTKTNEYGNSYWHNWPDMDMQQPALVGRYGCRRTRCNSDLGSTTRERGDKASKTTMSDQSAILWWSSTIGGWVTYSWWLLWICMAGHSPWISCLWRCRKKLHWLNSQTFPGYWSDLRLAERVAFAQQAKEKEFQDAFHRGVIYILHPVIPCDWLGTPQSQPSWGRPSSKWSVAGVIYGDSQGGWRSAISGQQGQERSGRACPYWRDSKSTSNPGGLGKDGLRHLGTHNFHSFSSS